MPRVKHPRHVRHTPTVDYYKPRGAPLRELTEAFLTVEGLEALRLADLEGATMEEAARTMGVSRHTFSRVLAEARHAVADALVHGRALRIGGGDFILTEPAESGVQPTLNKPSPHTEDIMRTIAITSEGPTLSDRVDPRFGRAGGFVVVDLETMQTRYVDNGGSQALAQGAGIQAAQNIAREGAEVLVTGYVGPKAFQALAAAGVIIVQNMDGLTVQQAVDRIQAGDFEPAAAPNR